jgi:hypothetical protein
VDIDGAKQSESDLGLEAQNAAIAMHVASRACVRFLLFHLTKRLKAGVRAIRTQLHRATAHAKGARRLSLSRNETGLRAMWGVSRTSCMPTSISWPAICRARTA